MRATAHGLSPQKDKNAARCFRFGTQVGGLCKFPQANHCLRSTVRFATAHVLLQKTRAALSGTPAKNL